MPDRLELARARVNHARHRPPATRGFYESFFQRANHPTRPLAFWIRYTLFSPAGRPEDALGELWAVYFDGERGRHAVAKVELPLAQCAFATDGFAVRVGDAELGPGRLRGEATSSGDTLRWDLRYEGAEPPLFFYPLPLYDAPLPKAKSLVGLPLARYAGTLRVNDEDVAVDGWVGSQNHNWGSRHTDQYAWGQVAGFDGHPETFLEVATARLKIGPVWTPNLIPLVLRHRGHEYALNGPSQLARARAAVRGFDWTFRARSDEVEVEGEVRAPREHFVGLRYFNPPGGVKHCLNTKIASCTLRVTPRRGPAEVLTAAHRAAFEVLTSDFGHGVPLRA